MWNPHLSDIYSIYSHYAVNVSNGNIPLSFIKTLGMVQSDNVALTPENVCMVGHCMLISITDHP